MCRRSRSQDAGRDAGATCGTPADFCCNICVVDLMRLNSCRFLVLAALALIFFPSRLSAAQEAAGRLTAIKASGSQRFSSPKIATETGLTIGREIKKEDLQAAANRLIQLGIFSDVRYRFSTQAGTIDAEFQVTDGPSIAPLFDNFPWFTDDEIAAALKSSVPLYDGRVPQAGTILDQISQSLEKLLETRKVTGTVSHQEVRLATSGENVQQFRVEGPELSVDSVEFSDPVAKNDHAIQQSLGDIRGKPFSRAVIDRFIFEQVRPIYLAHANLRVAFDAPQARFTGDPSKPLSNNVKVIIGIRPGPVFKWAGATWTGNTAFSAAELDAFVATKTGDSADGMKIELAWQRILDAYGNKGYLDAALDKAPVIDDAAGSVSYRVTIQEGPQYHMGALVLTGLSLEGERRVIAAWKIPDGAVFNLSVAEAFVNGGARAAFGDLPWGYAKVSDYLQKDPQSARVDVLMDFQ
jgi:outer membrane protein assembly factor BamA